MTQISKKFTVIGTAFSGLLAFHDIFAGGPELMATPLPPPFWFPADPGVSLAGSFAGFTSGWVDSMVPVVGMMPTSMLYVDPQALYHSSDEYSASVGGGFRILTQSTGILGAYVFGDYNHSSQGNAYWFVSPGLERLGDILDFSVNGYFPVSSQRVNSNIEFASQGGNFNFVQFSGHDEFDELVQNFESTGPGVDGAVGYRLPFLPNNTKIYLGGYYFAPQDNDSITGGLVKLDVPVSKLINLNVSDSYDNIFHNTVRVGASLVLGGRSNHYVNHDVDTRMLDPIQRNQIAVAGHSGTDQYTATGQENLGMQLLETNIWFFAPGGTDYTQASISECTFEHPCATNDVNTSFFAGINAISPNADMFLAPGTYDNLDNADDTGNATLVLNSGQDMYGRTTDFTAPASGNDRPLLIGSLDLFGFNTIDSLRLGNAAKNPQEQAITLENNAQGLNINNVLIGNLGSNPGQAYEIGIQMGDFNKLNITNSEIDVYTTENESISDIYASNLDVGNMVQITNSVLQVNQAAPSGNPDAQAILNDGYTNSWTLIGNKVNVTGGDYEASAFRDEEDPNVGFNNWYVKNNTINVTSTGGPIDVFYEKGVHNTWNVLGNKVTASSSTGNEIVLLHDDWFGHTTWVVIGNTMTATGTGGGSVSAIFDSSDGSNTWIIENNKIVATANGDSFGFSMQNASNDQITMTNNTMTISGDRFHVGAIYDNSHGDNIWTVTNNQMSITGTDNTDVTFMVRDTSNGGNTWNLSGNTATVSAGGTNVYGIDDESGSNANMWTLSKNSLTVSNLGASGGNAIGFFIQRNNDLVTSTGDSFTVTNTGLGNAYGFASNLLTTGTVTGIDVHLNGDTISATSSHDAYGVFDANTTGNTWGSASGNTAADIVADNTITVVTTGGGQTCKVSFDNVICQN